MYMLRLLGGIGLSDDNGRDVDALLRKPKHAALLAYLSMPRPGTWHRRDSIAATFWPDNDQARGRSSLRSALLVLRRRLPEGAIASRGDDELSLAPEIVMTDVAAMSDDVAAGRFPDALRRYQGELLPGLFIPDAPDFDRWLDQERMRVRALARKAATQLSQGRESDGNLDGAIDAARHASELSPDDEATVRRLITLLDRSGDRAQAFAVYERFRKHTADTFGVRPSAETVAVMDAVRTRRDVVAPAAPAGRTVDPDLVAPSVAALPVIASPTAPPPALVRARRRWLWLAAPVAAVVAAVFLAIVALRPRQEATATDADRTLIVLPMDDETGDSTLAFIASGLADGVAHRLEGLGGLRIRSGARTDWPTRTRGDIHTISRALGSTVLLRMTLGRSGDSLQVGASVLDAETDEHRQIGSLQFSVQTIRDAESRLASRIAGEVFRIPIPTFPDRPDSAVNRESYALMLRGWHQYFVAERQRGPRFRARYAIAAAWFDSALAVDVNNARAWSGVSTIWGNQVTTGGVPFEDGVQQSTAAAWRAVRLDSMQGSAWANLAAMYALKDKDLRKGLSYLKKAEQVDPSNPEVFLIKGTMFRSAHRYDDAMDADRFAKALDPLNANLRGREAETQFCANRPLSALALADAELAVNPSGLSALEARTRALALLDRYDEALESWRTWANSARNEPLGRELASAAGREGYWRVRHADGRSRLAALDAQTGWQSPLRRVQAAFAAGDAEAGYREIDKALAAGTPGLYRLACMPDIDEFRNTPRFAEAIRKIGSIDVP